MPHSQTLDHNCSSRSISPPNYAASPAPYVPICAASILEILVTFYWSVFVCRYEALVEVAMEKANWTCAVGWAARDVDCYVRFGVKRREVIR